MHLVLQVAVPDPQGKGIFGVKPPAKTCKLQPDLANTMMSWVDVAQRFRLLPNYRGPCGLSVRTSVVRRRSRATRGSTGSVWSLIRTTGYWRCTLQAVMYWTCRRRQRRWPNVRRSVRSLASAPRRKKRSKLRHLVVTHRAERRSWISLSVIQWLKYDWRGGGSSVLLFPFLIFSLPFPILHFSSHLSTLRRRPPKYGWGLGSALIKFSAF